MVPKPLHPSKIKALPESVGIEEGRGSGRDRRERYKRDTTALRRVVRTVGSFLIFLAVYYLLAYR